jgi:hypothetical protein
MLMERRRRETLADRQARVGIVANPKRISLNTPVPRDVWTRWPDLRSAHRRKPKLQAAAHVPPVEDPDPLANFAHSVRGASSAQASISPSIGSAALPSGKKLLLAAFGALTLCVGGYLIYLASLQV